MREWSIPYRDYTQPADRVRTAPSQRWSLSTVPVRGRSRIAQPAKAGGERHFGRHDEPGQPEPRESKCKKRSMQMPKVV